MHGPIKVILGIAAFIGGFALCAGLLAACVKVGGLEDADAPAALTPLVIFGCLIVAAYFAARSQDLYDTAKDKVKAKVDVVVQEREAVRAVQASHREYASARESLAYLSTETLLNDYERYNAEQKEDIHRLALEEELVRRGAIEHSPMHEKLHALRRHFGV